MSTVFEQDWFIWALAIVMGFPLASAVLGQLLRTAELRKLSFATSLWYALNILLPVTAFFLIFRYVVGAPAENTGNRILLTVALFITIYVVVAVFNAIFFGQAPEESWRARTPKLLRDIILGMMVVVGGGIVASQVWDQNVAGIFTALGIGSVILGFALQETLGNIMLGLSMLMERPYLEGDTVKIGATEGKVSEINWRATRLVSGLDTIVIPHAVAAKEIITNFSRPDPATQDKVVLGFGYDHAPNTVKNMLLDTISNIDGVLRDPPPSVAIESYGEAAITYGTTFSVVTPGDKGKVRDRFLTTIWSAAKRADIVIPYPIRTVQKTVGNDDTPDHKSLALDAIGSTPLFNAIKLSGATLDAAVKDAKLLHYAAGETILKQASQKPMLYVVVAGTAKVSVSSARQSEQHLYDLDRGDFFGETSVFSGAESPYAVSAKTDVEILSLSKDDAHRLIEKKPSLAMEIGQIIEIRRKAITAATARR